MSVARLDRRYRPREAGVTGNASPVLPWIMRRSSCPAHAARAGEPCWKITDTAFGVCGLRVFEVLSGDE